VTVSQRSSGELRKQSNNSGVGDYSGVSHRSAQRT
jgi:hypothetical protein